MRIPLTRYGRRELWAFGGGLVVLSALIVYFFGWFVALPAAFLVFVLAFFRDPDRTVPEGVRLVVAPADGRVTHVDEVDDETLGGRATRISIFLSVFDVHVNRAPVSGAVVSKAYHRGGFMNAMNAESARTNERSTIVLESGEVPGLKVTVTQIAGLIARRIVCAVEPGDKLARGERFGMIKFGSRTDVCVPAGRITDIRVKVGDHVAGGKTLLGVLQ